MVSDAFQFKPVMAAGAVRARPRKIEPTTAHTAVLRSWARIQNFHPTTAKYRGRGRGPAVRPLFEKNDEKKNNLLSFNS